MSEYKQHNYALTIYEDIAIDINRRFRRNEIDVMMKIYRWTKSERNSYFFLHILKRIQNYKSAIKRLRSNGLIRVIRGKEPLRITKDGIRAGILMIQLEELDLL